jgi:discoidin domain receptor family protein 2
MLVSKWRLTFFLALQEESGEQHFALGKFTTLKLPADSKDDLYECGPEPKSLLLEFSRHRLRVIEKLGEGSFGMVSITSTYCITPCANSIFDSLSTCPRIQIHLCETEFTCDTYGHTVYHKKQVIVKSMRRGISEETRYDSALDKGR